MGHRGSPAAASRQPQNDVAVTLAGPSQRSQAVERMAIERMAIERDLETAALVELRLRPHALRQRRPYRRVGFGSN